MKDTIPEPPFALTMSTPPVHPDAVVLIGDAPYLQAGLLLAQQLREKESHVFDIVLLCTDPIEAPEALLQDMRTGQVEVRDVSLMPASQAISVEAYIRIFLPYLLPEYRRICYLDTDMYLNRPGLAELLQQDMQGMALAAVRDPLLWEDQSQGLPGRAPEGERLTAPTRYFNSGLLIFDSATYRSQLPLPRLVAELEAHQDALPYHDQSFLNAQFAHRHLALSPLYNFPMTDPHLPLLAETDPVVLHFFGALKPWYPTADPARKLYWEEYEAFLTTHFGNAARRDLHLEERARASGERQLQGYGWLHRVLSTANRRRKRKRKQRRAQEAARQALAHQIAQAELG